MLFYIDLYRSIHHRNLGLQQSDDSIFMLYVVFYIDIFFLF